MMSYEKFDAWQASHALVIAVLKAADTAKSDPRLVRRLCYTSLRAAGRIAFGAGTRHRKMFRTAVARAGGYLSEFSYHLSIARVTGILPENICQQLDALRGRASFYTFQLLDSLLAPPSSGPRSG